MQQARTAQLPEPARTPTAPTAPAATAPRLRTVTGSRWPLKCACGCGQPIPRDPEVRYVVDFGAPRPYPAYLREHSPDYGSYRGSRGEGGRAPGAAAASRAEVPPIVAASALPPPPPHEEAIATAVAPSLPASAPDVAHADGGEDASPSPSAGRPWASGQLVFNAGSFESARSGFADYARDGETPERLRERVHRVILEDLERRVLALRALHAKLRDAESGASFGDVVVRGKPLA